MRGCGEAASLSDTHHTQRPQGELLDGHPYGHLRIIPIVVLIVILIVMVFIDHPDGHPDGYPAIFFKAHVMIIFIYPQVENILQSDKGHFVLCDFGSATARVQNPEKQVITGFVNSTLLSTHVLYCTVYSGLPSGGR